MTKMKFKCIYNGGSDIRLTVGKLYEVLNRVDIGTVDESITIIDDVDDESIYYINDWFINATEEIRNEKIEKILNRKDP